MTTHPRPNHDDPRQPPRDLPRDHALRALHAAASALHRCGELTWRRPFVLDPATACPVVSVEPRVFDAAGPDEREHLFFIPDEPALDAPRDAPAPLQLLVTPEEIDARAHEAADRYAAYHGRARSPRMALLRIHTARLGADVLDADELAFTNPLRATESSLLRLLNADRALLAIACERAGAPRPHEPLAVGVDPWGLHVKGRVGVHRVEFPARVDTPDAARAAIESLLNAAR